MKEKTESLIEEAIFEEETITEMYQPQLTKAVTNALETSEFFVETFLSFYDKIIGLVMDSFSHEDEKVKKITTLINNILL